MPAQYGVIQYFSFFDSLEVRSTQRVVKLRESPGQGTITKAGLCITARASAEDPGPLLEMTSHSRKVWRHPSSWTASM